MTPFAPVSRSLACASLLAAWLLAAPGLRAQTDPECQGPVHGRTRDDGASLTVTMVSGTVAPGTRGFVCVPWTNGTSVGKRLAREIVAVSAWSDQVLTQVTMRSATNLVPDSEVTFARVERTGSVTIETDAGRASVLVGGARLGGTPFVAPLPAGTYTFEVARPGYEPATRTVTVRAGTPTVERITLLPLASPADAAARGGALRITSTPPGAAVWIDGAAAGTTPTTASTLTVGPHEVEVLLDTLAAPLQIVEVGVRPQTVAFAMDELPGFVLVQTRPPGHRVSVEGGSPLPTPALVATAAGTRSIQAQGAGYRGLASPVVVRPGLLTVTTVPADAAVGWIDVRVPPGAQVTVGGSDAGQGPMRLRAAAGPHEVAVTVGGRELTRQTVQVADGASVEIAAGDVAAPIPMLGGAAVAQGGAEAVIDIPDEPAVASAPVLVAGAGPAAPPDGGARIGATAPTLPAARVPSGTGTAAADPTCQTVPVGRLAAEADDRLFAGGYDAARACLVRLATLDPAVSTAVQQRIRDVDQVRTALEIRPGAAASVATLQAQMRGYAAAADPSSLLVISRLLFRDLPGDPTGLLILRRALATTVAFPTTDIGVEAAFVPGAGEQRPDDAGLLRVERPPTAGFRLATSEATNRAFAAFLNTVDPDDVRPLIARDLEGLRRVQERFMEGRRQRTRVVFEPIAGREDLPAVDATWQGANAFAQWAGGRLPTAAEWEWALRVGQRGQPAAAGNLQTRPTAAGPAAVRSFPADALGLYDMVGNLWEWVAPETATAPNLLLAGGGSYTTDAAALDRSLFRTFGPNDHHNQTGIRVLFPVE